MHTASIIALLLKDVIHSQLHEAITHRPLHNDTVPFRWCKWCKLHFLHHHPLKNHKESPPNQPQKPSVAAPSSPSMCRVHVYLLRATPPDPLTYSLRSPSTTQLAPSTKAGFRNLVTGFLFCQTVPYLSFLSLWGQGRRRCKDASAHISESYPPWCNNKWIVNMFKSSHQQLLSSFLTSFLFHISESIGWFSDKTRQHSQPIITFPKRPTREHT